MGAGAGAGTGAGTGEGLGDPRQNYSYESYKHVKSYRMSFQF